MVLFLMSQNAITNRLQAFHVGLIIRVNSFMIETHVKLSPFHYFTAINVKISENIILNSKVKIYIVYFRLQTQRFGK